MLRDRVRGAPRRRARLRRRHRQPGASAGASIAHPHAQVFALDFVPPAVAAALGRCRATRPIDLVRRRLPRARRDARRSRDGDVARVVPARVERRRTSSASRTSDAGARFDARRRRRSRRRRASRLRDALARLPRRARRRALQRGGAHRAAETPSPFHWYVEITPRALGDRRLRAGDRHLREHGRRPSRRPRCCARSTRVSVTDPRLHHDRRAARRGVGRGRAHRDPHRVDARRRVASRSAASSTPASAPSSTA